MAAEFAKKIAGPLIALMERSTPHIKTWDAWQQLKKHGQGDGAVPEEGGDEGKAAKRQKAGGGGGGRAGGGAGEEGEQAAAGSSGRGARGPALDSPGVKAGSRRPPTSEASL